MTNDLKN